MAEQDKETDGVCAVSPGTVSLQSLIVAYAKGNLLEHLHNLSPDILKDAEKKIDKQIKLNAASGGGVMKIWAIKRIKAMIEVELEQRGL